VKPNPALIKLGFENSDRVVIIHADDIGMCQASLSAYKNLWNYGTISSGAIMVPCPWFMGAAKLYLDNPQMDLGVHITLTSEWDNYRWGPISTRDPTSGMIDAEGYFYRSTEEVQENGDPGAVSIEMVAQVERALSAGINVSHVDTHMGAVGALKFIPAYLQLSSQFSLPTMMMRLDKKGWIEMGFDKNTAGLAVQMIQELEEIGIPLIDQLATLELDRAEAPEDRLDYAKEVLGDLKAGITHFIIHPSEDTPELREITSDWRCRVADYRTFMSQEMKDYLQKSDLEVIGYRDLRSLMNNA
jgi:predicted glycoside hydrolase/deacetylase ChbG (UPF0249 family)